MADDFNSHVSGIGMLAEPVRRELYLYVCRQPRPVSREQAAGAVHVAPHQAKFHLDKLEAEGLLETTYARLSGKTGPGAGRPAKLYRRAAREIAVSLPDREYALAGLLMADAIAEVATTGGPILDTLSRLAHERGVEMGRTAMTSDKGSTSEPTTYQAALAIAVKTLTANGYEPRDDGERVVLVNCPFHALAQAQTELVCTMNHALVGGITDSISPQLGVELEPADGRCCIVLGHAR